MIKPGEEETRRYIRDMWSLSQSSFDGAHPLMTCPFCGDTYVHFCQPELHRGGNYEAAKVFNVRGDVLVLPFWCESGHSWTLVLGEHKGNIYSDIVKTPDEIEQVTFDSPIEEAFWDRWLKVNAMYPRTQRFTLVTQYPIGKYRVDFAHIETMTAIELDGFAAHSSTDDIARDRKRQREIEEQGWHMIRFGGKEIHQNAIKCAQEVWLLLERRQDGKKGGK